MYCTLHPKWTVSLLTYQTEEKTFLESTLFHNLSVIMQGLKNEATVLLNFMSLQASFLCSFPLLFREQPKANLANTDQVNPAQ